jgi:phosphoribosylanthranilate isomerase
MMVKVCGLTRKEDAIRACELGADLIGVVLAPGSRRTVRPETACEIFRSVRRSSSRTGCVALCKPDSPIEALEIEEKLRPDYIQLHPAVPVSLVRKIRERISGLILVIPVPPEGATLQAAVGRLCEVLDLADIVLVDTFGPQGGGTGKVHDWRISREIVKLSGKPVLLAGGLTVDNVAEAVRTVRPAGVDVASGVESSVGVKDERLMAEFIRRAREALL